MLQGKWRWFQPSSLPFFLRKAFTFLSYFVTCNVLCFRKCGRRHCRGRTHRKLNARPTSRRSEREEESMSRAHIFFTHRMIASGSVGFMDRRIFGGSDAKDGEKVCTGATSKERRRSDEGLTTTKCFTLIIMSGRCMEPRIRSIIAFGQWREGLQVQKPFPIYHFQNLLGLMRWAERLFAHSCGCRTFPLSLFMNRLQTTLAWKMYIYKRER